MRAMFKRHTNEVNNISFSPDGRSLVSGSDDHSVCLWNIRDGSSKELPVTDDADYFLSVVFSPDGRYIAAGGWGHSIWIWDSRTHKLAANWKGHSGPVWFVGFTPDGKGLMSGGDTKLKCWDARSLGIHEAISGREAVVPGDSFPLARSFYGHTVRLCFYFVGCSLSRYSHLQENIYSIAFFPNNSEWIITSAQDGSVRVWNIRTGVWQLVMRGHWGAVMDVDIGGTENFIATASPDCNFTLWRYEVL